MLRSEVPMCTLVKESIAAVLSPCETEAEQKYGRIERCGTFPVAHIPPIRQVSSGRQHCGLNGEKRCEKTDVAPKKARYFRFDGRAGEFERRKVGAGGSPARSRKRKEHLEKSVDDDRRHLQPGGPTHQQQEKRNAARDRA